MTRSVLLLIGALSCSCASAPPPPDPPGSFAFAALGDGPYHKMERVRFKRVLAQLDAAKLDWVLHVGDIFWHPCSDEMYARHLGLLQGLRHPVILTPGDNEWADCHEPGSGRFDPLERLARLRAVFYPEPGQSIGPPAMSLETQGGREPYAEFVENARWQHDGIVFATLHLVGSWNAMEPFPGRTQAHDVASRRRTEAAMSWLGETFAVARAVGARAVFLALHADMVFEKPVEHEYRMTFEPFLGALEEEVANFDGPVVLTHGDSHEYKIDRPLVRRTTGERLENFTRMEVPGSPDIGWVRVVVTDDAEQPFRFEPHVVSRWTFW